MKTVYMIRHGRSMGNVWHGAYSNDMMNFLTEEGEVQAKMAGHKLNRHGIKIEDWHCSELTRTRQTLALIATVQGDWKRQFNIHQELNENHFWSDFVSEAKEGTELQKEKVREWTTNVLVPFLADPNRINVGIVSHYFTMQYLFNFFMLRYNFGKRSLPFYGEHIENGAVYVWTDKEPDRITIL